MFASAFEYAVCSAGNKMGGYDNDEAVRSEGLLMRLLSSGNKEDEVDNEEAGRTEGLKRRSKVRPAYPVA